MRFARKGFTLIELLVVVAIIGVLLSLVVTGVGAVINSARESATETTIRKVTSMLNQRQEALHRLEMRRGFLENRLEYYAAAKNISAGNENLRKVLARKLIARAYFPQTRQEVLDSQITCGGNLQPKIAAASSANSSEILYDFLIGESGNTVGLELIDVDSFSASEATDLDQNGLPEFIDAWGHPLRFYRWPTMLMSSPEARLLLRTLPADLTRDPDDPLRLCKAAFPNFATMGVPAHAPEYPVGINGPVFHDPAVYHVMLVVSAGPDGILGLAEPDQVDPAGPKGYLAEVVDQNALLDDITYLSVRMGGK